MSKDRATRMVSAHVVPLKGAAIEWVIQQCARDLERLGHHGQVTLEFDKKPAIVDALKEIANLRGSRGTLLEHWPVADSQSNGFHERGIRSVEEMTRVLVCWKVCASDETSSVTEYMAPALAVPVAPPDPVTEYVVSTPTVPGIEYVTPVPVTDFVSPPARVIEACCARTCLKHLWFGEVAIFYWFGEPTIFYTTIPHWDYELDQ